MLRKKLRLAAIACGLMGLLFLVHEFGTPLRRERVFLVSPEGRIAVLDPRTGEIEDDAQWHFKYPQRNSIEKVYLDPKRQHLLTVRFLRSGRDIKDTCPIEVFDAKTLDLVCRFPIHTGSVGPPVLAVSPSCDSYFVAWCGDDDGHDYVTRIDAKTLRREATLTNPEWSFVQECWVSEDGERLFVEDWNKERDKHLLVFNTASLTLERRVYFDEITDGVLRIEDIKAGCALVWSTTNQIGPQGWKEWGKEGHETLAYNLFTYDLATGKTSKRLKIESGKYPCFMDKMLSADAGLVIGDDRSITAAEYGRIIRYGRIHIFDLKRGEEVGFVDVSDGGEGRDWALSPNGRWLYYLNKNLNVIDIRKGEVLRKVPLPFDARFVAAGFR